MKRFNIILSLLMIACFVISISTEALAQGGRVPASPRGTVSQQIGSATFVTFDFGRPGVKERKIWGELVPWGMYEGSERSSDGKPYPWRIGANKNTNILTTDDILIEGRLLPAGNYGMHMIASENEDWILIFTEEISDRGSFKYYTMTDVFRVNVKPVVAPHQEWMMFGFEKLTKTSAVAFVHWEKLKIPFKIELVQR